MSKMTLRDALLSAIAELQAGRFDRAESIYHQVLHHQPNNADAIHYLGLIAHRRGNVDEALRLVRRSIELAPQVAPFHSNLGKLLRESGDMPGAIASYRKALELNPKLGEARHNLSVAEAMLAQQYAGSVSTTVKANPAPVTEAADDVSLEKLQAVIADNPADADAHFGIGAIFHARGEFRAAAEAYQRAITLRPHMAAAHLSRGQCLLALGDFAAGWPEYEWRWQMPELAHRRTQFRQPQWDGSDLGGRTILLHYEQGFGDTIQFIRFAPLVAQRGGRVLVQCQRELHALMQSAPGVERVVSGDNPLPDFDTHLPLLSLPRVFATTAETIPASVPYLHAPPAKAQEWRQRLPDDKAMRVGLIWAGHPQNATDRYRSIPLWMLGPLLNNPKATFISLQTGLAAQQLRDFHTASNVMDAGASLRDFSDTAALMENLDLVISVDTAGAHLAGALARQVWLLLPSLTDWRWLTGRDDSPWYPTMRLFRQKRLGDWPDVVNAVAAALDCF